MKRLVLLAVLMTFLKNSIAQFVNVTTNLGIDHECVSTPLFGGGVLILDYNNDNHDDIYFIGGQKYDQLYHNNGDNSFTNISGSSNVESVTDNYFTSSALSADFNNDGFTDIFLTTYSGNEPNILLKNEGEGVFSNVTSNSNFLEVKINSTGAALIDANSDGLLDIYVLNYIEAPDFIRDPDTNEVIGYKHTCYSNRLYINQGNFIFADETIEYGLSDAGCSLASLTIDIDNDNDLDIIVVNDFGEWVEPNKVYINNYPDKSFTDKSTELNLNLGLYGMGISTTDFNNDSYFDFYVSDIGANTFMLSNNGFYENHAGSLNMEANSYSSKEAVSWGTFFFDFDNDGSEDLFVSNGFITAAPFLNVEEESNNFLLLNKSNTFTNIFTDIEDLGYTRGAAYFDYNNDGKLDFVTNSVSNVQVQHKANVYQNSGSESYNWLKVDLEGTLSNSDAIGAKVDIFIGDKILRSQKYGGGSFASQSMSNVHFGLGSSVIIDSLKVSWPSGIIQIFKEIDVNQTIQIVEDQSIKIYGCTNPNAENYNPKADIDNGSCEVVTSTEKELGEQNVVIYQQDDGRVVIRQVKEIRNLRYKLLDLSGREIQSGSINRSEVTIQPISNRATGLALIFVYNENYLIKVAKIVK